MAETELKHGVFWKEMVEGANIPGSTRVPVFEIKRHLNTIGADLDGGGIVLADLGSGSGRSTGLLKENFPLADVLALDLSHSGLQMTESTDKKVQSTVEHLPLSENSVDAISLCGVMTNLVDREPVNSLKIRHSAASEIYRVLKPEGLLVVSDFARPHILSGYGANYPRHALITREEGTIAVFDPSKKITFKGLNDDEIRSLEGSPDLLRFAHHYTPEEIISVFKAEGLKPIGYSIEIGSTPSGNPIDNIILSLTK